MIATVVAPGWVMNAVLGAPGLLEDVDDENEKLQREGESQECFVVLESVENLTSSNRTLAVSLV